VSLHNSIHIQRRATEKQIHRHSEQRLLSDHNSFPLVHGFRQIKMSEFWNSHEVRFELTGPEIYWLEKQSGFCSDGAVEILTAALEEWIPRNTDRCVTRETVTAIL
jgi:hypothetical protein